ncbi:hypothetical protein K439DRAFT_1415944 [Ramaria rubella]|nr:hypothetical protein K439DRAFT_1415944 [Ramaria rubella]
MSARVSNATQRGDRKVVFKSVLDNPFKIPWPHVPLNVQNVALASLLTILTDVGEYHLERHSASKKRKRARHDKDRKERKMKKRKVGEEGKATSTDADNADTAAQNLSEGGTEMELDLGLDPNLEPAIEFPPAPPVLAHLIFGINEVTKRLESQAQSLRPRTSIKTPAAARDPEPSVKPEIAPLAYVFVCRADIDPPILIAHFPELVAACNVPTPSRTSPPVHLIPLPKLAENTLAEALGLRRVSVLAIDSTTPSLESFSSLLAAVQPPSAPWLTGPAPKSSVPHIPTHIKQLRTTAPKDMHAAKRERTESRRAAKERRKTMASNTPKTTERMKGDNAAANTHARASLNLKSNEKKEKWKRKIKIVASTTVTRVQATPTMT